MKGRNQKPEANIQKAILQYLAIKKIPAWRMNSGAYKSEASGTFVRYGNKGMSDIIAIMPKTGKWFAIEVKSEKGRLTESQKEFARVINENNGYAIVARSVDDVIAFIDGGYGIV